MVSSLVTKYLCINSVRHIVWSGVYFSQKPWQTKFRLCGRYFIAEGENIKMIKTQKLIYISVCSFYKLGCYYYVRLSRVIVADMQCDESYENIDETAHYFAHVEIDGTPNNFSCKKLFFFLAS